MQCGQKERTTIACYRLPVHFTDSTGHANCLLFSDEVNKLVLICNAANDNGNVDMDFLGANFVSRTFVVGVKRMANNDSGKSLCSFVVACLEDINKLTLENVHTPEKLKTILPMPLVVPESGAVKNSLIPSSPNVIHATHANVQQISGSTEQNFPPSSSHLVLPNDVSLQGLNTKKQLPSSSHNNIVTRSSAKRKLEFTVQTPEKNTLPPSIDLSADVIHTLSHQSSLLGQKHRSFVDRDQQIAVLPRHTEQVTQLGDSCGDEESIADNDDASGNDEVVENTYNTKT